jgi:hypothetical protein
MLLVAMAAPAVASRAPAPGADPADGHTITICHATRSLSNPYVEITIDVAAWNDPSDPNHHGDNHTRTKNGVTWKDYILADGQECTLPPPPQVCPFAGTAADFVIDFGGVTKLYTTGDTTKTVAVAIPAGTYDVTLISGDYDRNDGPIAFPVQPNERWRLLGTTPSGYSNDLPDSPDPIVGQVTTGLQVSFGTDITSATAQHWSAGTGDTSNQNSVVPEFACLVVPRS